MNDIYQLQLGITGEFQCSYLPQRREQLLLVHPNDQLNAAVYSELITMGFRRGGEDAYRPRCPACEDCQSIRIKVADFTASKSQKRVLAKNKDMTFIINDEPQQQYFDLYSRYISARHATGSMYPPLQETLDSFTQCNWLARRFIEGYFQGKLISVAVCDVLDDALSAVYTFFDPTMDKRSLGQFNILQQIFLTQMQNKTYLYLGYQIDDCGAMNYKRNYYPNERFIKQQWIKFKK